MMNARIHYFVSKVGITATLIMTAAAGCATTMHSSPLPEAIRSKIRKVAVVPAAFAPREDFATLKTVEDNPATFSETAKPTVSVDEKVTKIWQRVGEAAWVEGWHMPVGAGIATAVVINPMAGAFVNLSTYAPIAVKTTEAHKQQIEAAVGRAYDRITVTPHFAERIAAAGARLTDIEFMTASGQGPATDEEKRDYHALASEGVDTVIEVGARDIGFIAGPEDDPAAAFFLHAGIRSVGVADGGELYSDMSTYVSPKRRLSAWMADNAKLLRSEIEKAQADMAVWIVEKLFLVQELTVPFGVQRCLFESYYPPEPHMKFGSLKAGLTTPQIDSLQPAFRWEPFPREMDRTDDSAGLLAKVSDITYDLKIWKVRDGYPEAVVYERTGIPAPTKKFEEKVSSGSEMTGDVTYTTKTYALAEHRLETKLDPSTVHFWSVRARFKLDGRTRVTKWSYSRVPYPPTIPDPCGSDHIPLVHYYRFKTPAQ